MNVLEKEIEARLTRMVERHGGLCLKWVCPGWAGVPDRILLLPGGLVMFAETKRPRGGELSRLQEWWAGRLRKLGFTSVVVWDRADVDTLELVIINEIRRTKS